jgi:hypothetical protein
MRAAPNYSDRGFCGENSMTSSQQRFLRHPNVAIIEPYPNNKFGSFKNLMWPDWMAQHPPIGDPSRFGLSEHENACASQFKVSLSNGHQSGFLDHSVKAGLDKQGK